MRLVGSSASCMRVEVVRRFVFDSTKSLGADHGATTRLSYLDPSRAGSRLEGTCVKCSDSDGANDSGESLFALWMPNKKADLFQYLRYVSPHRLSSK